MPDPIKDPLQPLIQRWLQSDDPDTLLEQLCREHPEHADALRSRLAGEAQTSASDDGVTAPAGDPGELEQIGPYRVLGALGEGGMGTVYLAEQREPVRRRVALKLIKLGMDTKAVVQRFEQERQALAVMDHEGIAKVYDVGTTERGQPYFVMELVKGIPLDEFCERNRLSLPRRLELMQQVCAAVQHAHQKGVIHRDLKPGNVLVSNLEGRLQIKIIDFGLAKAMGQKLIQESLFTELGVVMGTPEYMAPEQADPSNLDIDTQADVYSLGVMLYQLLVGQLPFSGRELREAGLLGMQRLLREVDPPKPSTRLQSVAAHNSELASKLRVSPSALKKALKGDLDWVVVKALEKDRGRRYTSANALAEDLQRFLDHEPLEAGPPSAAYRLQKLLRRHRAAVTAVGLILLACVVGGVATFVQWRRAEDEAQENLRLAESERAARQSAASNAAKFAAKVAEFDQLAGVVRYGKVEAAVGPLLRQAPWPSARAAIAAWLRDCDALLSMRSEIEATVASLRAQARRPGGDASGATSWTFGPEAESQEFLHETLQGLLGDLQRLAVLRRDVVSQRLLWSAEIERLTRAHPNARVTWSTVRDGVAASEKYAGCEVPLRDADIGVCWLGLVPLGANPVTGLYEFYHLRSACGGDVAAAEQVAIPTFGDDGAIAVGEDAGIVFVLLPGGRVTLGSQSSDPQAASYDPARRSDEGLHTLELSPFLLARHELTQGQWARLGAGAAGEPTPSAYAGGTWTAGYQLTAAHPVESVDWTGCQDLMRSYGLVLPTEAQWEYGCRAGARTPWCVAEPELARYANLADQSARSAGIEWAVEGWADEHVVHAPVGSFSPNLFGLYDMHGNVAEWCQDVYAEYGSERAGDGLNQEDDSNFRVYRGGAYDDRAAAARSAARGGGDLGLRRESLGLRPARSLVWAK